MHPKVDQFIQNQPHPEALETLRELLLTQGLEEYYKWKQPVYGFQGKNLFLIAVFKDYFALSFFNGALLKDEEQALLMPGPNSQSVRYLKFETADDLTLAKPLVERYVDEAIALFKQGVKVAPPEKKLGADWPVELVAKMKEIPELKEAFEKLTPGRQRGYTLFIAGAKQSKTRTTRVEKYIPRILDGFGIHDCVCGRSKRMPTCDGSHKNLEP